jgi:hypothetical protein
MGRWRFFALRGAAEIMPATGRSDRFPLRMVGNTILSITPPKIA